MGGYVEELLVTNAAENVLARALGLEENPTPNEFDEKILEVPEGKFYTIKITKIERIYEPILTLHGNLPS